MRERTKPSFYQLPLWATVLVIFGGMAACDDDNDITEPDDEPGTIADVVAEDPDFSTLLSALQEAGLVDPLDDDDATFTVFAPNDGGFQPINVDALLDDPDALEEVLGYHVVPDAAVESGELSDGDSFTTLSGDQVTVQVDEDGTVRVEGATVTTADVEASNGVVHVLDRALLGNQDLANVARFVAETEGLHDLLVDADLDGALGLGDSWTVFGPDNQAIEGAEDLVEELDDEELQEVLQYHVYPDDEVTSSELLDLLDQEEGELTLETLQGEELLIALENEDQVVLNDEQAELRMDLLDFHASNGVLHVIDGVLLPPSLEDEEENDDES